MRNAGQLNEVSEMAKALLFQEVQYAMSLSQNGLTDFDKKKLSKICNLILSLDSVSLDSNNKNLGADELAQLGATQVDTQVGFVESNYWEGGYNQ
jgi:hypothetical protein